MLSNVKVKNESQCVLNKSADLLKKNQRNENSALGSGYSTGSSLLEKNFKSRIAYFSFTIVMS